jgi:glycosyltransferase involved in cell wall biosynthesis
MTFTIIIPFYKTQEYVKETLDSIKNQKKYDLKDVQVLFINDGDENFDLSILAAYKDSIPNIDYYKKHNTN